VTGHPSPTRRLPQPSPLGEARNPSCSPRPLPLAVSVAARPARRSLALVSCYLQSARAMSCVNQFRCAPRRTPLPRLPDAAPAARSRAGRGLAQHDLGPPSRASGLVASHATAAHPAAPSSAQDYLNPAVR
jgi:hypothetical protein